MSMLKAAAVAATAIAILGACVPATTPGPAPGPTPGTMAFTAQLNGAQEVPAVATPGTGTASMTYNDATNVLTWAIQAQNLTGNITGAHFHGPAAPGQNAGVQVPIPAETGSATLTADQEAQLRNGLMYINLHTALYPNGEIRGQVLPQ